MIILYKVQKKDGSLEDFNRGKIVSGIMKAGGTKDDADMVAAEIEEWLPTAAKENVVSALEIRDKGLDVFRRINPTAAQTFELYKKPK